MSSLASYYFNVKEFADFLDDQLLKSQSYYDYIKIGLDIVYLPFVAAEKIANLRSNKLVFSFSSNLGSVELGASDGNAHLKISC